mmetsp:Transcript_56462/g.113096  ORF Transcript_56462/g.113096 Transcript_56462/m.113096 type:complete len:497 (+) Transcript_56462:84-1574(+)
MKLARIAAEARLLGRKINASQLSSSSSTSLSSVSPSPDSFAPATPFAADVTVKITDPSPLSNRKKFNQLPLNSAVLNHLDRLNLGFIPGRVLRKKVQKYRDRFQVGQGPVELADSRSAQLMPPRGSKEPSEWTPPPAPFGGIGSRYCSATRWEELPKNRAKSCEIAIAGRSNVGKSTLLNVLAGLRLRPQKRAAVSPTPGETKALEFFRVGRSTPLSLVDMPGYGFSFAKDAVVDGWSELMVTYLRHRNGAKGLSSGDGGDSDRQPLKRLVLLVDARHGLKVADKEFLQVVYDKKRTVTTTLPKNVKLPAPPHPPPSPYTKGGGSRTTQRMRSARQQQGPAELVAPNELVAGNNEKRGAAASAARPSNGGGDSDDGVDTNSIIGAPGGGSQRGKRGGGLTIGALAAAVADPPKLQVVLTKCDLVKRKDLVRRVGLLREDLRDLFPFGQSHYDWGRLPVVMLSSLEDKGVRELQRELASLATYKGEVASTKKFNIRP